MTQRLAKLLAIGLMAFALTGCDGLQERLDTIGDTIRGIATIGQDLFEDGITAQVYLDGQPILEIRPDDSEVALGVLPLGNHLIHAAASNYRGAEYALDVRDIDDFDEADLTNTYVGGQIRGTVTLAEGDGATRPAARALVYAIPGGIDVLHRTGRVALPGAVPPFAAYTDEGGEFDLRAVPQDDYLVITTVAGYMTDMQLVVDLGLRDTREDVDLTLQADPEQNAAQVAGSIARAVEGWDDTDVPAVWAQLARPYVPMVSQDTLDRVTEQASVAQLPEFRFTRLSTLADEPGDYALPVVAGSSVVTCFAFRYIPALETLNVSAGEQKIQNFTLQRHEVVVER